jgi:hypothetical protein
MLLEGGDRVDASDSPKQIDEYHFFKLSEGQPGWNLAITANQCDRIQEHELFA